MHLYSGSFNPFVLKALFLYPLKTSGNLSFSDVFRGQRTGALGRNGLTHDRIFKESH